MKKAISVILLLCLTVFMNTFPMEENIVYASQEDFFCLVKSVIDQFAMANYRRPKDTSELIEFANLLCGSDAIAIWDDVYDDDGIACNTFSKDRLLADGTKILFQTKAAFDAQACEVLHYDMKARTLETVTDRASIFDLLDQMDSSKDDDILQDDFKNTVSRDTFLDNTGISILLLDDKYKIVGLPPDSAPNTPKLQNLPYPGCEGASAPVHSGKLENAVWNTDQLLGKKGAYPFAGIYEYENLTINDDVTVYSTGISQLVIKVNGTLVLGKNVNIRVRNGYYSEAPDFPIADVNSKNLNLFGSDAGGFRVYEKMYGRGGDGGSGGDGLNTRYATSGGGGGGGGFGGGIGGVGGAGGMGSEYTGQKGGHGAPYGSYGGAAGIGPDATPGGEATNVGNDGENGKFGGNAGSGGGGNGGNGGKGCRGNYGVEAGGNGGGGGGYGGGILIIIAEKISYDSQKPPKFIVAGQVGGKGATNGQNGEGGMLIIVSPHYQPLLSHWSLTGIKYGKNDPSSKNGGHGVVTSEPQKVFINGIEVDYSNIKQFSVQ